MAKHALFADQNKKGVSTPHESQKVKAVQRFIDQNVGSMSFHNSPFPAEAEPRIDMEIK